MPIATGIAIALAMQQINVKDIIVSTDEPFPAEKIVATNFKCGRSYINIEENYKSSRKTAALHTNISYFKNSFHHKKILESLERMDSLYRYYSTCEKSGTIKIVYHVATMNEGSIDYRSGVFYIGKSNGLVFGGEILGNASSFWFK